MDGEYIVHRAFDNPPSELSAQPVRRLHEEDICRSRLEDVADIASSAEVADRLEAASLLLPHEEQRRAGTILPSQHCVAAKIANVEVRVAELKRRSCATSVRIDCVHSRFAARDRSLVATVHCKIVGARRLEFLEVHVTSA